MANVSTSVEEFTEIPSKDVTTQLFHKYSPGPDLNLPEEEFVTNFKEDCYTLLSKFSASKCHRFKDFAKVWKEMMFSHTFNLHELIEFEEEEDRIFFIMEAVPEMFVIAKSFLLPEFPKSFRKGAFFLLYAMYFRQPFRSGDSDEWGTYEVSLDLTELKLLKQIYEDEKGAARKEMRLLYKKLQDGGGINYRSTYHDPVPYIEDHPLKAHYYTRLMELSETVEVPCEEWKDEVSDYMKSLNNFELFETLWETMNKHGRSLSPVPKFFYGVADNDDAGDDEERDDDDDDYDLPLFPDLRKSRSVRGPGNCSADPDFPITDSSKAFADVCSSDPDCSSSDIESLTPVQDSYISDLDSTTRGQEGHILDTSNPIPGNSNSDPVSYSVSSQPE